MAEPITENLVPENIDAVVANVTTRQPSTPEGMAVAYASLVIMALIPIFIGSYRSVRHHEEQKVF